MAARFWAFSGIIFLTLSAQVAYANCRLYLAQGGGFALALKTPSNSGNACQFQKIELELSVGGNNLTITPGSSWKVGTTPPTVYTVTAVLTNTLGHGPAGDLQFLTLNSATTTQSTSGNAVYTPADGTIAASYEQDAPLSTPNYLIRQLSLSLSGLQGLTPPLGGDAVPSALIELAQGPAPWFTSLPAVENPVGTTTVTATFRLDPALPAPTVLQSTPYIDTYGQAIAASWTGKISSKSDLDATVAAEEKWLKANQGLSNVDQYGGMTGAWTDTPTGYYYVDTHNDRSFLISPLGNPLFYLGVTSVDAYSTPVTPSDTRGLFFDSLPPANKLFRTAYAASDTTFSFIVANQLRKYCTTDENNCVLPVPPPVRAACPTSPCTLTQVSADLETVRFASWAFSGEGKFFSQMRLINSPALSHPAFPVLEHDAAKLPPGFPAVDNLVSHPDPFNSQTVTQLDATLALQIGPHATDPNVVGWSMGNEKAEIIDISEVKSILRMVGTVPAKRAFMFYALHEYGTYQALDAAWHISATTEQQLIDTVPDVKILPTQDLENLREYYEDDYYGLFRDRVKNADHHHHLYFGSWIVSGDKTLKKDWPIAAKYSDVVGFDDFNPGELSQELIDLFDTTPDKPVLLGAWGAPTDYAGTRGFGWKQYTKAMTLSDSDSGDAYALKLNSLAANKHVVGAMLFDYYDEPLTGRGGSGKPGDLVIGEDFAFGLLDTTDTPKYDFVNKVREANCLTLATLGLTTCPVKK